RFASGEIWHDCVTWAVDRSFAGMENLALIPGTMGAAPIQNIGAYGVEVESVIEAVHAVRLDTGELLHVSRKECAFGYRDSVFKNGLRNACFITAVDCRLMKRAPIDVSYAELSREIADNGIANPGIRDVFDAVVAIRTRKLPDVRVLGNAGSFFKNPVVSPAAAHTLADAYPDMPMFATDNGMKLSAAWLIDRCGCKGLRRGDAAVYEGHALVLVNHGRASGRELLDLAGEVGATVRERFGVELEIEVRIIDMQERGD
ncbi:MAG: UDP-N-acetylmuramate dehydrogenase, partial [Candidatus Kapaibacterium sp.]